MDLHEIEHKTVSELREMAGKYEDIEGASGLKKERLLEPLCEKLGIDRQTHVPEGIGRRKIKAEIRATKGFNNLKLRAMRDERTTDFAKSLIFSSFPPRLLPIGASGVCSSTICSGSILLLRHL